MGRVLEAARAIEAQNQLAGDAVVNEHSDSELALEIHDKRSKLLDELECIVNSHLEEVDFSRWHADMSVYLTATQRSVVEELGIDKEDLKKEFSRCFSVRRWRGEAGTTAERETAKQELELARSELDDEGPKIESQIAELQRRLRSLHQDSSTAAAKVERQAEAVKQLRDLVPPHVKDRKERHLLKVQGKSGELSGVRARQEAIRKLAGINIDTLDGRRQAIAAAHATVPDAINFDNRSGPDGEFVRAPWLQYIRQLQAELADLQTREAQLVEEIKSNEGDLVDILDHYAR